MSHLPAVGSNEGVDVRVRATLGDNMLDSAEVVGELTVIVPRAALFRVVEQLRDAPDLAYEQLVDIAGADFPEREARFDVNYHMLSLRYNRRIRVKVRVSEHEPVPSVSSLFPNAGWLEREIWDMFGVSFEGNPDLRRILTDYGFEGHPFRKDFPLTGHVELHYSEEQGRVVYAPVKLKQDFRSFDFLSPWEGNLTLPGDEKATPVEPAEGAK